MKKDIILFLIGIFLLCTAGLPFRKEKLINDSKVLYKKQYSKAIYNRILTNEKSKALALRYITYLKTKKK